MIKKYFIIPIFTLLFFTSVSAENMTNIDQSNKVKKILSFFNSEKSLIQYDTSFQKLLSEVDPNFSSRFKEEKFVDYMLKVENELYRKYYTEEEIDTQYSFFYEVYPKLMAARKAGKRMDFTEKEKKIITAINKNRANFQRKTNTLMEAALLIKADFIKKRLSKYPGNETEKKKLTELFIKKCSEAYDKRRYQLAFVACSIVEDECSDCEYRIAVILQKGWKVAQNEDKAVKTFEKLAAKGHLEAAQQLGLMILENSSDGKDERSKTGLFWLMSYIERSENSWMAEAQLKRFNGMFLQFYSQKEIDEMYNDFKRKHNL